MVERYFTLEDPTRLEPAERELYVETVLERAAAARLRRPRSTWRPTGEVRVVDYKTGRAPRADFEAQGAVPDEVLRAGAVADDAARCRGCCS